MSETTAKAAPPRQASVVKYKSALRKSIRRNRKEPEVDFLNITAMLDLMTIILVFLLKSLATSSGSIPQSDDLTLPLSVMTGEPSQSGVVVIVSKTQILLGDTPIAVLPSRDQLAQSGVDTKYKRNGPNDLFIVPLANALTAVREDALRQQLKDQIAKGIQKSGGTSSPLAEANIVADATTPYRLLIEVLYTLGQAEFGKYHLMVMSGKKN